MASAAVATRTKATSGPGSGWSNAASAISLGGWATTGAQLAAALAATLAQQGHGGVDEPVATKAASAGPKASAADVGAGNGPSMLNSAPR